MRQHISKIIILTIFLALTSCGVKTDPVPPETPAEMGRIKPQKQKQAPSKFESSDDEEEE